MLRSIGKQSVESVLAYVLLLFYCLLFFNHFYQTNYLNIYRINLHEICRIGRTLIEVPEIAFGAY